MSCRNNSYYILNFLNSAISKVALWIQANVFIMNLIYSFMIIIIIIKHMGSSVNYGFVLFVVFLQDQAGYIFLSFFWRAMVVQSPIFIYTSFASPEMEVFWTSYRQNNFLSTVVFWLCVFLHSVLEQLQWEKEYSSPTFSAARWPFISKKVTVAEPLTTVLSTVVLPQRAADGLSWREP